MPVLVDEEGGILAGHCRVLAAALLELEEVPVIVAEGWTEPQKRAYVELAELDAAEFDLSLIGFSAEELEAFEVPDETPPSPPEDPAPEPEVRGAAVAEPGDVWRLGAHRLMVGDSFNPASMAHLCGDGEEPITVPLIATDPPYAVYGSSTGLAADIADDKMVRPFFAQVFDLVKARLRWFGHAYVFGDWRGWGVLAAAAKATPHVELRNVLVWDKGGAGLGSNYGNAHEFIGFFHKLPDQTAMGNRPAGVRSVHKPNIVRHARASGDEREHNAAKPIALMVELIQNSSKEGDHVLEPFAGSGSTLIACEREGRICLAMEMDPRWADVTVRRWQRETGKDAVLEGTGQTFEEVSENARTAPATE